jgi:hypothetical protein
MWTLWSSISPAGPSTRVESTRSGCGAPIGASSVSGQRLAVRLKSLRPLLKASEPRAKPSPFAASARRQRGAVLARTSCRQTRSASRRETASAWR